MLAKTEIQTHAVASIHPTRSRSIINRQRREAADPEDSTLLPPQIRDSQTWGGLCGHPVEVLGQGGAIRGGTRATPSAPSRVGFRHQSGSSLKHAGNGSDSLECRGGSGNPLVLLSPALSNGSTSLSLSLLVTRASLAPSSHFRRENLWKRRGEEEGFSRGTFLHASGKGIYWKGYMKNLLTD